MSLLFTTRPLIVNPDLAELIGLNEAIVLQQVHYWLNDTSSGVDFDGKHWVYNSAEEWLEQFPFWSESTLKRAIAGLKKKGLMNVEQLEKKSRDMTNYYSINYDCPLLAETPARAAKKAKAKRKSPSSQNDQMDKVKLNRCIKSKRTDAPVQNEEMEQVKMASSIRSKCLDDPTEITTEITTETKTPSCPVASQPDPEVVITDLAKQALSHLNLTTGSRFQVCKTSLEHIRARLREGFTPEELMLVVDYSTEKWGKDLKMAEYLRPTTLFLPSKFPGYLQSATKWAAAGRPKRIEGRWAIAGSTDQSFKSSYSDVDYSGVPKGFRT